MSCMPEYQTQENFGNYEQQEQDAAGQYCPPNCNQCTPPPTAAAKPGYYDCSAENQCYNMTGRDCTEYCDPQCYPNENQQNEMCMSPHYEPLNQAGGDNCRPCPDSCQLQMCSPFKKRRYVQPPRRNSFRPHAAYKKSSIPMATETIYRKSFEKVDSSTAMCCRPPPFNPSGFLRIPGGAFEKETVTKMSFQPICGIERRQPIRPAESHLLGRGPMQALTTQKHDFVPKFQYPRQQIAPRDNISKSCGCIEKCTIQRMSYMNPCSTYRTKSFKPVNQYKQPDLPMAFETTQKLSYMPVCPKPKEQMPWARKASYIAPSLPFEKDTVTKLSFQPPGCFIDDDYCCEPCEPNCCEMPRAAAC